MYQLVTASVDLTTKGRRLYAWHFSNTVAAAVINLRNGSVSGDIVAQIQLAVATSASQAYSDPRGLAFPNGLYVQIVSGTIVGSVDVD